MLPRKQKPGVGEQGPGQDGGRDAIFAISPVNLGLKKQIEVGKEQAV